MAFEFRETMAGSYHLLHEPLDERPMSFTIRCRSHRLAEFLRSPIVEITGEVDAEGFADHQLLRGTLGLDLLRNGTLSYAFRFLGNDDAVYRFEGRKDVSPLALAETMSILPGAILSDRGDAVAAATLRFDIRRDIVKFLRSWHLV
jgi:hypothetical protein